MRSLPASLLALALAVPGAPRLAGAQSGTPTPGAEPRPAFRSHAVAGRVTDTLGTAVAGAQVLVDGKPAAVSDDGGGFVVRNLEPTGFFLVRVRRIGYAEASGEVRTGADGIARAVLELVPLARALDTVRVTARASAPWVRFEKNRRTRASAATAFLDRDDVEERATFFVSDALRGLAGVTIKYPSPRAEGLVGTGAMPMGRRTGRGACQMSLLVNGYPRFMRPQGNGDFDFMAPPPGMVEAIEVYARAADVPAEYIFHSDMLQCGAVVVWTRTPGDTVGWSRRSRDR